MVPFLLSRTCNHYIANKHKSKSAALEPFLFSYVVWSNGFRFISIDMDSFSRCAGALACYYRVTKSRLPFSWIPKKHLANKKRKDLFGTFSWIFVLLVLSVAGHQKYTYPFFCTRETKKDTMEKDCDDVFFCSASVSEAKFSRQKVRTSYLFQTDLGDPVSCVFVNDARPRWNRGAHVDGRHTHTNHSETPKFRKFFWVKENHGKFGDQHLMFPWFPFLFSYNLGCKLVTRKVQLDTRYGLLGVYLMCVFFFFVSERSLYIRNLLTLVFLSISKLGLFCQYLHAFRFQSKSCAGRRSGVVSVVWKFGYSFQRWSFCVSIH